MDLNIIFTKITDKNLGLNVVSVKIDGGWWTYMHENMT